MNRRAGSATRNAEADIFGPTAEKEALVENVIMQDTEICSLHKEGAGLQKKMEESFVDQHKTKSN